MDREDIGYEDSRMEALTWAGLGLRVIFTVVCLWLTVHLVWQGVTATTYPLALTGLAAVVLLWLTPPETAGRLSMFGVEIDRRIEAAQMIIERLEHVEAEATKAAGELAEMVELESLRPLAMLDFYGRQVIGPGIRVSKRSAWRTVLSRIGS